MLSSLYAIARSSVTMVIHTKMVGVRIMKFSPFGIPMTLVLRDKFHLEILMASPERGRQTKEGGENQPFCSF